MRIDILTLFPGMFAGPFDESIVRRAAQGGLVEIHVHDIRQWAEGRHKVCDDYPYGGGPGMVMKPEPIFEATESVLGMATERGPIILLTPAGRSLDHDMAVELAREDRLLLLCGHYEGFDARVHEHLATHEVSIGDFVLSGGEIAAMAVVDAVVRHLPGALGCADSVDEESYAHGLLEAPHYTRPPEFKGWKVPEVLLSGHHAEVAKWRRRQNLLLTAKRRPDLLARAEMTEDERLWLEQEMGSSQ